MEVRFLVTEYSGPVCFVDVDSDGGEGDPVLPAMARGGLSVASVFFLYGFYRWVNGGSLVFAWLGVILLGWMFGGSLIGYFVREEFEDADFYRGARPGILPNLMVSAVRGEWDWWDTVLLGVVVAAFYVVYSLGVIPLY